MADHQRLFKISPALEENRDLQPKPLYISLGLPASAFPKQLGGSTDSDRSPYTAPKGLFDTALRGTDQYGDRIWFFRGDSYLRYWETRDGVDKAEGPVTIADEWGSWPASFRTGVDAALQGAGSYSGKVWFFKGGQYFRFDMAGNRADFAPKPVAGNWRGVPDAFAARIDAAIHGVGQYFGACWLFKGSQYLRYNVETDTADGPRPIAGNWGGATWPRAFADGIDFAFYGKGADAEKIAFFRGDQYIVYNLKTDLVEEGPAPVVERWRRLAQFMPRPQLFIVERYGIRTFHGEMGRGDMVEGPPISVPPGGQTEFYIVMKRNTSSTYDSSLNILESQTEQAVDSFSQAVRDDQSQAASQERYDYNVDASFHGEAQVMLGRGEASADLHVKGGSQDVRTSFANAVNRQVQNQASQTQTAHKQQVRTETKKEGVEEATETGFKQVIDNRNSRNVLNCVMFQLTQEYIVILSLVDAQIAFHNGNPRQSLVVPIRDMPTLLEQCIGDPQVRARIAATVVDTLQNIVDYSGKTRSLIASLPNEPSRHHVDRSLTATYEVEDSTGALVRSIVVPGIILNVDRPVVLTPNTVMAPLEVH